jgi:PAS domain S-box/diguanylate cyclase (GGDEF) domain
MDQGNKYAEQIPSAYPGAANMTVHEMQRIVDSIPGGVALFAREGESTLLYANEGFYRICGYSREDLLGKPGADILELLVPLENSEELLKHISEQHGDGVWLESRIRKKDGGSGWVRLNLSPSPVADTVCCIFTDITREKQFQQELQMQQERYRIITEQLNDVFFEYNFDNDTMYASSRWEELFGYPLQGKHVMSSVLTGDYVYDDDKEILTKILSRANEGIPTSELEVRIRKAGGGYIWTSISTTIICDDAGKPVKVIGKIADIDERKREREKLISNAQREPLTGLYNKVAVESYIRTCLRASDKNIRHALMIIDVDNFKGVNDSLGHLFGDAVLKEISAKLRTLFRSTDILGRFGGDEFIVFIKNVGENQQIAQKANAVCDIFRETYTGDNKDYKISGSVGISIYPEHGKNFYELFKSADTALYEAKNRGKDGFVISGDADPAPEGKHDLSSAPASLPTPNRVMKSIVTDVYQMLNETKDVHSALQFILQLMGREFLANRVFIFEKDGVFRKTFEWHAENKKPLKTPGLYAGFDYALRRFREDGYYYCPDIALSEEENGVFRALKFSGVKALLQVPVFESGELTGVIGLEGDLPWPIDERRILLDVCKIIGSCLTNYRNNERTQKELSLLRSVNERLGLWSYVVEPGTWRLLYLNSAVQHAAPTAKPGDCCYRVLKGRNSVCEDCPAARLEASSGCTAANLFDVRRKQWFHTTAAPTDWNDSGAVLLCSADIARLAKSGAQKNTE